MDNVLLGHKRERIGEVYDVDNQPKQKDEKIYFVTKSSLITNNQSISKNTSSYQKNEDIKFEVEEIIFHVSFKWNSNLVDCMKKINKYLRSYNPSTYKWTMQIKCLSELLDYLKNLGYGDVPLELDIIAKESRPNTFLLNYLDSCKSRDIVGDIIYKLEEKEKYKIKSIGKSQSKTQSFFEYFQPKKNITSKIYNNINPVLSSQNEHSKNDYDSNLNNKVTIIKHISTEKDNNLKTIMPIKNENFNNEFKDNVNNKETDIKITKNENLYENLYENNMTIVNYNNSNWPTEIYNAGNPNAHYNIFNVFGIKNNEFNNSFQNEENKSINSIRNFFTNKKNYISRNLKNKFPKRKFGYFNCEHCENNWTSVYCWKNEYQQCKNCNNQIYPYKIKRLKPNAGESTGPHDRSRCGMCKRVGDCTI